MGPPLRPVSAKPPPLSPKPSLRPETSKEILTAQSAVFATPTPSVPKSQDVHLYLRPDSREYRIPEDIDLTDDERRRLSEVIQAGKSRTSEQIGELLRVNNPMAQCAGLQLLEDSILWSEDDAFSMPLFDQLRVLLGSEHHGVQLGVLRVLRFHEPSLFSGTEIPQIIGDYMKSENTNVRIASVELCFYMADAGDDLKESDTCLGYLTDWIANPNNTSSSFDAMYDNLSFFAESPDSFQGNKVRLQFSLAFAGIIRRYLIMKRQDATAEERYPSITDAFEGIWNASDNKKKQLLQIDIGGGDLLPDFMSLRCLVEPPKLDILLKLLNRVGISTETCNLRDWKDLKSLVCRELTNSLVTRAVEELRDLDAVIFQDLLEMISNLAPIDAIALEGCQTWSRKIACESGELPSSMILTSFTEYKDQLIAGGGFSELYIGSLDDRKVMVKIRRPSFLSDIKRGTAIHEILCAEILIWRQVAHKHVIPLYGVFNRSPESTSPDFALVVPWMENGDINRYLASSLRVDPLLLMIQVAEGLDYLHSRQFYHGNIKPGKILISAMGRAYLSDVVFFRASLKDEGSSGGTMIYMAPETFTADYGLTEERDVYAFAMTLYEVLSGRAPFENIGSITIMLQIERSGRPARPSNQASAYAISDECWDLITVCWEHDPKERLKAGELLKRMQALPPTEVRTGGNLRRLD